MISEEQNTEGDSTDVGGSAIFAIAWSPEVLSGAEYARLIGILGDLVRATGAVGVERVRSQLVGGKVGATTLV